MFQIYRSSLAAAAMLLTAGAASAQSTEDERGVYVGVSASITDIKTTSRTIPNVPAPGVNLTIVNPYQTGHGGAVAIGYAFGRVRAEAEIGHTDNDVDRYVVPAGPFAGTLPLSGGRKVTRYMANGYFELTRGSVRPYAGAGIGAATIDFKTVGPRAFAPVETPRTLVDFSDTRFAYQLMAGLALKLGKRATISGQYRWLDAGSIRGADTQGVPIVSKHRGHNFDIGVRVRI